MTCLICHFLSDSELRSNWHKPESLLWGQTIASDASENLFRQLQSACTAENLTKAAIESLIESPQEFLTQISSNSVFKNDSFFRKNLSKSGGISANIYTLGT
jgi:hypothetical protein